MTYPLLARFPNLPALLLFPRHLIQPLALLSNPIGDVEFAGVDEALGAAVVA